MSFEKTFPMKAKLHPGLLVALAVVAAVPLSVSASWHLAQPCSTERQAEYRQFRQRLLEAGAESPSYLPHPFPKNDGEVVEDLIFSVRKSVRSPVPETDRRLFEAMDSGTATFRVTRVADWTPLHCGPREERSFYYLVQIFDRQEEITRGTVAPSGAPGTLLHWASGPFKDAAPPLPTDPAELVGDSLDGLPSPRRDFQYVSLWGSVRCDDLVPCVTFRAGPEVYLWWWEPARDESALLRLDVRGRRYSIGEQMSESHQRREFLHSFRGRSEEVITLGGDAMGTAVRVRSQKAAPH